MTFIRGRILSDGQRLLVSDGDGSRTHALHDLSRPLQRFPAARDTRVELAVEDSAHAEIVQFLDKGEGPVGGNALRRWSLTDGKPAPALAINAFAEDIAARARDGRVAVSGTSSVLVGTGLSTMIDRDGRRTPVTNTDNAWLTRAQAFSADGRILAQTVWAGALLIDADSGAALGPPLQQQPVAEPNVIAQLAFAPDGRALVARTTLGNWLYWSLLPEVRDAALIREEADLQAPVPGETYREPSKDLRASWGARDRFRETLPMPQAGAWSCLRERAGPPPRLPATPSWLVDLSARYTAALHALQASRRGMHHSGFGNYCAVPLGVQRLQGVDYDLRGVVELRGRPGDAASATGRLALAPGRYSGLHVLGAIEGTVATGNTDRPPGRVRFHYVDGGSDNAPLWLPSLGAEPASWQDRREVSLAWQGYLPEDEIASGSQAWLYSSLVANPHPERELAAIEIEARVPISNGNGLVIAAITLAPAPGQAAATATDARHGRPVVVHGP